MMINHRHNALKTAALMGLLSGLIVAVGGILGGRRGLTFALVIAIVVNAFSYFNSDRLALRAMRARPVGEVEQPVMCRIVRELSGAARQPMPRLYVSPTSAPNAFATGRDPRHAAVCCTEGILLTLTERELRAVIAHELGHVYNRDILISSIAGALASVVMWAVNLAWFLSIGGDGDDDGPGVFGLLLAMVLGPIAAVMIQLAITRNREYEADFYGARLTGDPLALAGALRKLDAGARRLPLPGEPELVTTSHLMIVNPFRAGDGMTRLFSTHPPIEERIARLEALAGVRRTN